MRKILIAATLGAASVSVFSLDVNAWPGANGQYYESFAIPAAEGCGKGNHRNPQGQCVNGPAAAVAPPSSGSSGAVCPTGTRLSNGDATADVSINTYP
jgi:hypothetical protein